MISTTPTYIITGLSRPWGVVVNDRGEVIVSEYVGHRISFFSGSGEKVRSFGTQGFFTGLVIGFGYMALTDAGNILVSEYMKDYI